MKEAHKYGSFTETCREDFTTSSVNCICRLLRKESNSKRKKKITYDNYRQHSERRKLKTICKRYIVLFQLTQ